VLCLRVVPPCARPLKRAPGGSPLRRRPVPRRTCAPRVCTTRFGGVHGSRRAVKYRCGMPDPFASPAGASVRPNPSPAPRRHVIIGAMVEEVEEFLAHARVTRVVDRGAFHIHEAVMCDVPVAIIKCGVGKVFAAMITQHVIDTYAPASVISTGVAGGLSPALSIGDVVVSRDCLHHDLDTSALGFPRGRIPYTDYRFFAGDDTLVRLAVAADLGDRTHKLVAGRILTGDQFIHG